MSTKVGVADRVFLIQESADAPQHVAGLGIFTVPEDAPADYVERLAESFRQSRDFAEPFNHCLHNVPLRSVAPRFAVLDAAGIDLDHHFRRNALPVPGGERELSDLVSRLHAQPLDLRKPLWEVHLIEGLDEGRFAVYIKLHHALFDGIAGSRILQRMLSTDPDDPTVRAPWTIRRGRPRHLAAVNEANLGASAVGARALRDGRRAIDTTTGITRMLTGLALDSALPTGPDVATPYRLPRTTLNRRIGRQRRLATLALDFDRIRAAADRADVTINDVFLAICGGGLRRYLDELDALPTAGLVAGTPVSVRIGSGDSSNNAFTMTTMSLRTDLADPAERVRAIRRSSERALRPLRRVSKAAAEKYGALFMSPYVLQSLTGLGGLLRPPFNLVVSNVPGPLETQYLAGSRLESMTPFALLTHGQALFIAAITISGKMCIGFTADGDALPDVERLAEHVATALEELELALA